MGAARPYGGHPALWGPPGLMGAARPYGGSSLAARDVSIDDSSVVSPLGVDTIGWIAECLENSCSSADTASQ